MDELCRLCSTTKFVSNYIFDEETALYLKMSLYLPIKVFKNDRLPQKICDRCSCKVNDIYQFCNEAIEVQNRLRSSLLVAASAVLPEESIDLTLIKENVNSPPPQHLPLPNVSNDSNKAPLPFCLKQDYGTVVHSNDQSTQTENADQSQPQKSDINTDLSIAIKVKMEPTEHVNVKYENLYEDDINYDNNFYGQEDPSSDEDISLSNLKKKKVSKCNNSNGTAEKRKISKPRKSKLAELEMVVTNFDDSTNQNQLLTDGSVKKNKRGRPKKQKLNDMQMIVDNLQGSELKPDNGQVDLENVKAELSDLSDWEFDSDIMKVKDQEMPKIFHCCMCDTETKSRQDMLKHYREHQSEGDKEREPAAAPPPPADGGPLRCPRCNKVVESMAAWESHWARHWARDRRPLRCAKCLRTFSSPSEILRHGVQHSREEVASGGDIPNKFVCDLCPESFAFMRHLLSHRSLSHPEAAGRALSLRCALCGRGFAHLNSLRRHLRAHSGERNFLCNVCGKALTSREHLKFHIRIHTGFKPNVCKTCGKGFVKKCNLTLHERVHSGEKPHVCPHCGKAFSQRSTLVIHERYHSGARPYVCEVCGRGFVARGLLSMHAKTKCCERNT